MALNLKSSVHVLASGISAGILILPSSIPRTSDIIGLCVGVALKYNPEAVDISLVGEVTPKCIFRCHIPSGVNKKWQEFSYELRVTVMFIKNYLYDAFLCMVDSHSTTASQT
nr:hypothetical protein Iba_chr06dCG5390 [Ipomoea batatas]